MEVEIGTPADAQPTKPPTPAAPPAAPEPPPTPEQIAADQDKLMESMGWKAPTPKPEPALVAPPPPEPAAVEPPPAEPVAPEPPAPAPEPEPEPLVDRTADIIAQTARETGREVARAIQPAPAAPAEPALELSPDDQEDLNAISFLSQTDPKYAGKEKSFKDYLRKLYARQTEWEKANPDGEFNIADEEHADWYEANHPGVELKDIEKGKARLEARAEYDREFGPQIRALKQEQVLREKMPYIMSNVSKRVGDLVERVDPELAKKVRDASGRIVTGDKLKQVEETEDPVTVNVLMETTMNEVFPLLRELEMMGTDGLDYRLDPRNPQHQVLDIFRREKEAQMAEAPKDQQVVNGKQWVTISEMSRMARGKSPAEIADLEKQYWVLTVDDLAELLIDQSAKKAKAQIAQYNELETKRQKRRGSSTPPTAQPPPVPAPKPPVPAPAPSSPKPMSPSLSSTSDVVTSPKRADEQIKSEAERFIANQF